jgi:glycosyltransferase involved in cell wall biosynthesis
MEASVVIPARDAGQWIGTQLEALATQEFDGDFEVIVADNGSRDATASIAHSFRSRFARLIVVDASKQRGANFARNRGVECAAGKLLLFCDADDCASRTWVAHLVRASEDAPFLGGSLDLLKLNTALQRSWYGGDTSLPGVRPWEGFLGWVTSANFAMTPELARDLGPLDTHYLGAGDDIAVSWRATMLGKPPEAVPDAVMHYRLRPAGLAAWKHQSVYGRRQVTLYRQFASQGLPRRPWPTVRRSWGYTLRSTLSPFSPVEQRRAALRSLAYEVGRVIGSIEERTLYL